MDTLPEPPGPGATGPAPGGGWEEEKQRRLAAAAALSRVAALGDEERRRLQQTIIDEEIAHQRAQGAMLESQAKERQQLLADGEQRRLRLQAELQSKVVQGPQPLCNTKGTLLGDYLPQHSAAQNSQDSGTQHTSAFEGRGSENLSQVRLIREGRTGSGETLTGSHLRDLEQQKLMLLLQWDTVSYVLQEQETFKVATDRQKAWSGIVGLGQSEMDAALKDLKPGMDLLVVLEEGDLPKLEKLAGVLDRKEVGTVGLLVFRDQDRPLFPAALELTERLPWKAGELFQLSRQIHHQGTDSAPMQGRPRWAVAITATKEERSNRLQPKYGHLVLSAVDRPLEKLEVPIVAPASDLHAIQVDGRHLGELNEYLGKSGAACRATLGKPRGASRVVFARLDEEWAAALHAKWVDTPHFALMTIGEYEGPALAGCPLVVEVFCRSALKGRMAGHLWAQVDKALSGLHIEHVQQIAAFNKLRVGLPTVGAAEAFRELALPQLQSSYRIKDERTQQFLTSYADDTASEASESGSEAGSEGYTRQTASAVVLYDVPSWYEQQDLLEMLAGVAEVEKASPLEWTPGSPALAAWRLDGAGVEALADRLLVSVDGLTKVSAISNREYLQMRRSFQERQDRMRAGRMQGRPPTYAAAAQSRPGKGKGKGKGGTARTSLLSTQHGYTGPR